MISFSDNTTCEAVLHHGTARLDGWYHLPGMAAGAARYFADNFPGERFAIVRLIDLKPGERVEIHDGLYLDPFKAPGDQGGAIGYPPDLFRRLSIVEFGGLSEPRPAPVVVEPAPVVEPMPMQRTYGEPRYARRPRGQHQRVAAQALAPLFANGTHFGKGGAPEAAVCVEMKTAIEAAAACIDCDDHRRRDRAKRAIVGLVGREILGLGDGWLWLKNAKSQA